MINLEVNEYCHNCPEFQPLVDKEYYESGYGDEFTNTTVTCKYAQRCEAIAEYFKKHAKHEKN